VGFLRLGLAVWSVVWAVGFWYRTERLREWLGIREVLHGDNLEYGDRVDEGGLGEWVNCPACLAVLATVPVALLPGRVQDAMAGVGLAVLLGRWWEAARPKARWWE
jgi:hypothetical protein